ncbi:ABC transporter substrate-binding protein [Nocardia sp. NPDC047038]|uniref:ABC transporter substrate-binding protein n=1 Tax=Nocardia sp. NPDC047038 TaxID=3154338 RepID=UPI0033F31835
MKSRLHHTRRVVLGAAVAVLAVASAACGSDDAASPGASSVDPAVLGPQNPATGPAVTIGYISEGKGTVVDTSAELVGAQVAVDYINEHLGGLRGHRLKLKTCESKANPAAATDCANQMVGAGVVAVAEGALVTVDQTVDVLSPAGVPLILNYSTSQKALASANVFNMMNGVSAIFGTPAALAKEGGIDKAAMVTVDLPGLTAIANQLGKVAFTNVGAQLEVVPIPAGTPDVTSQISAANRNHPGLWSVLGNTNFCGGVLRAIKTADRGSKVVVNDRCVDPTISSSIPGGFEGVQVGTTANLDPATDDVKLFHAAIDKYKPGLRIEPNSAGGWQPVLGLARALNAGQGEVNRESVAEGLRSAPPLPFPLTGGIQFQCNGRAFPLSPNVCASDIVVATADKGGTLGGYRTLHPDTALFVPPSR